VSQATVDRNMGQQEALTHSERARLLEQLEAERVERERVEFELEHEWQHAAELFRRAQDECNAKLADTERERLRVQESCRSGVVQQSNQVQQHQRRAEELQRSLTHVQQLLASSEADLAWVQQERTKGESDRRKVTRRLEDELRGTRLQLELARQEDLHLEQQCRAQQRRNNEEKLRLSWALDAAQIVAVAGGAVRGSASRGDLSVFGKACGTTLALPLSGNDDNCAGFTRSPSCPGIVAQGALTAR